MRSIVLSLVVFTSGCFEADDRATPTDAARPDVSLTSADAAPPDATIDDDAQTDAAQTDAAQTDAAQTDAAQTDAAQTDAAQTDAGQTDAAQTDAALADAALDDAGPDDAGPGDAAQPDALVLRSCPTPTVPDGVDCVLDGDATLSATMVLPSDTKVDCRGHKLTPATAGVLDDPRTTANEFQPSGPEAAMFLDQVHGATITNCVIDGFDFGIVVTRVKESGAAANEIRGNTILARVNTVFLVRADRVVIADNQLTYASERGRGIIVEQDSDDNRITGNTITSTDAARTGLVRLHPGARTATGGQAILDNEIHIVLGDTPLRNLVINGVLLQISASEGVTAENVDDLARPERTFIEGNQIIDNGFGDSCALEPTTSCTVDANCVGTGPCVVKNNVGVALNLRAADTLIRGNTFSGTMGRGVSNGGTGPITLATWTPGSCSGDASRLCLTDADCFIPEVDAEANGTCAGTGPITFNGNSARNVTEGNTFTGTYSLAVLFAQNTEGFVFRGNTIDVATSVFAAIRLALNTSNGTIERNVVRGAANAVYLTKPISVTNSFRRNDFTGYVTAIRTTNDYNLATDLDGNYWGNSCPGLDPTEVLFDNGTVNPNVTDNPSYGEPVATHADPLPDTCTP
jgi:nitrous oxidase accessory protein NosD